MRADSGFFGGARGSRGSESRFGAGVARGIRNAIGKRLPRLEPLRAGLFPTRGGVPPHHGRKHVARCPTWRAPSWRDAQSASSFSKRRTLSKRAVLEPDEPRTEALPEPVACGSRSDGDARGSVSRRARERRMTAGTITLQSSSCLSRRHPPAQRATGTCRHVRVKSPSASTVCFWGTRRKTTVGETKNRSRNLRPRKGIDGDRR
jgi:hypothetical protein